MIKRLFRGHECNRIFSLFCAVSVFACFCHNLLAEKAVEKTDGGDNSPKVDSLCLKGEISDKNINFSLDFKVKFEGKGIIPLISGQVCETSSEIRGGSSFLWGGKDFRLLYHNNRYSLECLNSGECGVVLNFGSRVEEKEQWKESGFFLLPAITRKVEIHSARRDVELEIPGALELVKKENKEDEGVLFTAVLPPEGDFLIKWRSHVEELEAVLVTSAQANVISEVLPGTVKLDNFFDYSVIQGKLSNLELKVSEGLNVLNVKGENIQDWHLEDRKDGTFLLVSLSRKYEDKYPLHIEAEMVLPDFPCKFSLPSIIPQKVLRLDGYLAFGTNRAIKLIIESVSGLNQIDNSAFPGFACEKPSEVIRPVPKRSVFTYRFAGDKYSLKTRADNIMPSYTVDLDYIVTFKDEDMLVRANCKLDIKDAPLRELMIKYDDTLMVNRVEGISVLPDDYELMDKNGEKWLRVPFRPDTMGKTDVFINFEKSLKNAAQVQIPRFFIDNAKSVRGYLLLAAAQGLSLKIDEIENLRKVHTGSAPVREPGLQYAFRFKDQDWKGNISLKREKISIVSEVFHIGAIGEGTVYGSSIFTYHISGAPLDNILIKLSPTIKNLEFTGRDIVDWKKVEDNEEEQVWQVNFREKIFGDYTLLAAYEAPLAGGENRYRFGDISTKDVDGETGFIVLSSARNLKVSDIKLPDSVFEIEASEIPYEYRILLHNPILEAYRFTKAPHWAEITIENYFSLKLIGTAVDHAKLNTRIDGNGESVTDAEYRIKNVSSQFLTMKLPSETELWSVKVNNEGKRVSSSEGRFLIPLPRNQNTDEPIAVSIRYAQKYGELGTSKGLLLEAPSLNLETMFSCWTVNIPDNYNFTEFEGKKGNMAPLQSPQLSGITGILTRSGNWIKRWNNAGLLIPWILLTLSGMTLAWIFGKKIIKMRIILSSLAFIVILIAAVIAMTNISIYDVLPPVKPGPVNSGEFTRLFGLPQDTLRLDLEISDMESFSFDKFLWCALALLLSCASFIYAVRLSGSQRQPFFYALGTTLLISAGSQWLYFNALAAFLLAAGSPLILSVILWTIIFKKYRRFAMAAACFGICFLTAPAVVKAETPNITIEDISYRIDAGDEAVKVDGHYKVNAEEEGEVEILLSPAVLMGNLPDDSNLLIRRQGNDYILEVKSSGKYEFDLQFLLPLKEDKDGNYSFLVNFPLCRRNIVKVKAQKENIDIAVENAVSFSSELIDGFSSATATFVPGCKALFRLHPQVRKVEKEKAVFFTNIDALAKFAPGFVEINNFINFQIAQGEIAKFAVDIPQNMRVTSVNAPDLGAWRYDPQNHLLEILLSRPHHGNFGITVTTQIGDCNIPYSVRIETLKVRDAGRQHGTLGLSADMSVQIQVDENEGFNPINTTDFTAKFAESIENLKKAFIYHKTPAVLGVKAISIEAEVRVEENCHISFEEERTVLISDLNLDIAKTGIFSVILEIPQSFEIDKLTGTHIQHWDEITENGAHKILVHFDKRVLGTSDIHLELSMMVQKRDKEIDIPKIIVSGAKKHKGELAVDIEHGTRMEIIQRQGLEVRSGGFRQTQEKASHRFAIVRPDWILKAGFEVIEPWIQVETLQVGRVSEGMLNCEAHFLYTVENAGVKRFCVRLPEGSETPEFVGENIAGVKNLSPNTWEIELHQKINHKYRLKITYRQPYEQDADLKILPVIAEKAELQKGYLAVLSEDSLQVKLSDKHGEITDFDARKIPTYFRQDYLSNAVICFRTVGADYYLLLDVLRHGAAKMLKAQIEKVDITSVVSPEGRVITTMKTALYNGDKNFLTLTLPEKSNVWSVFTDQQPIDVAYEKDKILIPLRQGLSGSRQQEIEIIYSLPADEEWDLSSQIYNGPVLDLPLRNVTWNLYLPPEFDYSDFEGTLEHVDKSFIARISSNIEDYDRQNIALRNQNIQNAKILLSKANEFAATGKQQEANEAFQSAVNLSANNEQLNADVQGQWIANLRTQSVSAFANRRSIIQKGKMSADTTTNMPETENQQKQMRPQQRDVSQIEQQYGGVEVRNWQMISDKIFMQQQAAATVPHPLHLTIPTGGHVVEFERALEVSPSAAMKVFFKARRAFSWEKHSWLAAGAVLVVLLTILYKLIALAFGRKYSVEAPQPAIEQA